MDAHPAEGAETHPEGRDQPDQGTHRELRGASGLHPAHHPQVDRGEQDPGSGDQHHQQ